MYNYVCSLGTHCHTSTNIKNMGLKKMSFPFDWIFSNTDMIIDCIADDFKIFLDKSHYVSMSPEIRCTHNIYGSLMFNHHDPLKNVHEYEYFVRCVNRFKALLATEKPKLFILTSTNNSLPIDTSKIVDFNNKFKKYTTNYKLLYIYHKHTGVLRHNFSQIDDIDILHLETLSHDNGIQFHNKKDNIYLSTVIDNKYKFDVVSYI